MTDKTWTVVGSSVKRGEKKLRLANGTAEARRKVLDKDGHTEVRLFDLPQPMLEADARAWLEAQGDSVPVPAPKPAKEAKPREPKPAQAPKAIKRVRPRNDDDLAEEATDEIPHEELGKTLYVTSKQGFRGWKELTRETREEFSRNAAVKKGIPCPPGTYPALEAFLLKEGITVQPDGTLLQAVAS
jgi:hypothetical protein